MQLGAHLFAILLLCHGLLELNMHITQPKNHLFDLLCIYPTASLSAAAQILRLHQPRADPPGSPDSALAQRILPQPPAVRQAALTRED